jgi:hypothetical protein
MTAATLLSRLESIRSHPRFADFVEALKLDIRIDAAVAKDALLPSLRDDALGMREVHVMLYELVTGEEYVAPPAVEVAPEVVAKRRLTLVRKEQ